MKNNSQEQLEADVNRYLWRNIVLIIFIVGAALCLYKVQITNMLLCLVLIALTELVYIAQNLHVIASEQANTRLKANITRPHAQSNT